MSACDCTFRPFYLLPNNYETDLKLTCDIFHPLQVTSNIYSQSFCLNHLYVVHC